MIAEYKYSKEQLLVGKDGWIGSGEISSEKDGGGKMYISQMYTPHSILSIEQLINHIF